MSDKVINKIEKVDNTYIFETYEKPLRQQIEDLKYKLAEKDKEIERIKQIAIDINRDNNQLRESLEEYSKVNMPAVLANRENKQYQNQKAIEELEKLKDTIYQDNLEHGYLDESVDIYSLAEYIDNRIKELKGE